MLAASEFVGSNMKVLFLPFISYLISLVFLVFWIAAAAFLYTIGEVEYVSTSPVANIKWNTQVRYAMWYFFFGLFWVTAFIVCVQQFMICALTCMWYFTAQGDEQGEVSVSKAMKWGMWYHAGSVAFGSFIIAVVTMIRVIFEYIQRQYEVANKENQFIKMIGCVIRYVLWMLDKYVKFITKNAFI
jgi:choline transporter-like protein 2/4/5